MIKKILPVLFLIILTSHSYAQQGSDSLSVLRNEFEAFQYGRVIENAETMLLHKNNYNKDQLMEIYRLKGVSEFSLLNDTAAKKSFIQILRIDSSYALDSAKTSPKIISFFNQIKNEYIREKVYSKSPEKKPNTVPINSSQTLESNNDIKPVIIRSLIFPGWGQIYNNSNSLKGWILTSLGVAALGSTVYFIIDCNNKQKKYLNDVNLSTIQNNYNQYNTSYKLKNISLISFIAVWVYSQIDVLFISQSSSRPLVQLRTNSMNRYQLSFKLPF